jgi:iron complex outermembrane recepter protein
LLQRVDASNLLNKRTLVPLAALAFLLATAAPSRAQDSDAFEFFSEEADVVTASRRPQAPTEAPLSVEVITAEDIRASGAVHIWDLFRFRAGITVLENRDSKVGNRAIVAIRDFPANFVDNLQVLIDGRSVYSIDTGGVMWEQLPVQLQDIERIEIVRGPNSALFGSNAGSGVVNIITKKPSGDSAAAASFLAGSEGGNRHLSRTDGAVEHSAGPFSFRVSGTHQTEDGFPDASGGRGNDYVFSNKGNFRGIWNASPDASLELFSGGSWDTTGVPTTVLPNNAQSAVRSHFEMAKWNQKLPGGADWDIFVSRSEEWRALDPDFGGFNDPTSASEVDSHEVKFDVEAQHHVDLFEDRLRTVWGGSWNLDTAQSDQRYAGAPKQQDRTVRGFTSATFEAADAWTAFGAVSLEDSDYAGLQPAYQVALSRALGENQSLRLSQARSPAQPSAFKLHANNQTSATSAVVGNPATAAEQLTNVEFGYIGDFLDKSLRAEANAYYQRNHEVASLVPAAQNGPVSIRSYVVNDETIARGVEAKLAYHWSRAGSIYANYTFESMTSWTASPVEQRGTPVHNVNFGGTTSLTHGFAASANAGWNDAYIAGSPVLVAVNAYWQLDARLAYDYKRFEFFVAGQNLTRPTHQVEFSGLEVPRTIYGGLSAKF